MLTIKSVSRKGLKSQGELLLLIESYRIGYTVGQIPGCTFKDEGRNTACKNMINFGKLTSASVAQALRALRRLQRALVKQARER